MYFSGLGETPQTATERAAVQRISYVRFKAWEAENADLVRELKLASTP